MQLEIISKQPKQLAHSTPLLFIHGAWHGAWCWENFLPYFAEHGYEVYALSLRGHGNSEGKENIRWYSVKDYLADVDQVVNSLKTRPVLIGHSLGGYVTQKYLEMHEVPASILLASLPVTGMFGMLTRFLIHYPRTTLPALLFFNAWYFVSNPATAKACFFSDDYPEAEYLRHYARIQTESYRIGLEATFFNLPRPRKVKTPLMVLSAENDRTFSIREQKATARAYHTEAVFFPNMAHDMMLEKNWQHVADKFIDWLTAQGL
jgi:pimeloyl-ACP methyl ester carboxylesterase